MKLLKDEKQKNNQISFFKKFVLKIFLFFLALGFLILSFLFFSSLLINKNFPAVIFFDVGQGDAILLRNIGGKNILIDGGPDNLVIKKLGKFLPYFSRRLDLVVLSHYHDDHALGLIESMVRYKIRTLILAQGAKNGAIQDLLLSLSAESKRGTEVKRGIETKRGAETGVIYIDTWAEYSLGSCDLFFLNPRFLEIPENDNNSLITKLNCPNLDFLFSGDNEIEVEKALLGASDLLRGLGVELQVDVFKASHHGSKTSNSYEFLELISAKIFVISVGLNNRFNHPAQEILERVKEMGLSIKRTDINGDIVFPIDF
ncbi:MBL fold metallo-hydrolase [Candidatus Falkowbacteria bacterium]|nr:MBL fold metallo-hydrolase [Candidatus Falkowbacteria bacterium]NCT54454.1 MBL fold metallo-hydrolase [Candidatus Falkowbacteria bacterium]